MKNSLLDRPVDSTRLFLLVVPDDIVISILVRLDDVRDVLRCQLVCKRWKDLTSIPQFEDLFLLKPLSNLPMILIKYSNAPVQSTGEFWIDKWWIKSRSSSLPIHKVSRSLNRCPGNPYYGSENGFIVSRMRMERGYEYSIRNPITSDEVKIVLGETLPVSLSLDIIGIYLHPIRKEYCILWRLWMDPNRIQYKMLNLGSSTKPHLWRNIGHPWTQQLHDDSNALYCLNDGFMYWFVNSGVMAFDIETEGLTEVTLPIGGGCCNLVMDGDGFVSLVRFGKDDEVLNTVIEILTLKDGRFWTASRHVLPVLILEVLSMYGRGLALAIENGELVFQSNVGESKQLFVFNLHQSGALLRKVGSTFPATTKFWAHYPTIASLRNCQPVIHITKQEIIQ